MDLSQNELFNFLNSTMNNVYSIGLEIPQARVGISLFFSNDLSFVPLQPEITPEIRLVRFSRQVGSTISVYWEAVHDKKKRLDVKSDNSFELISPQYSLVPKQNSKNISRFKEDWHAEDVSFEEIRKLLQTAVINTLNNHAIYGKYFNENISSQEQTTQAPSFPTETPPAIFGETHISKYEDTVRMAQAQQKATDTIREQNENLSPSVAELLKALDDQQPRDDLTTKTRKNNYPRGPKR